MEQRGKTSVGIIAVGLLLGILGDWLLRAMPWGINVALWLGALLGLAALLAWRLRLILAGDGCWLALPIMLFAATFAWRDSITLATLNMLVLLTLLGLAMIFSGAGRLRFGGVLVYLVGLIQAGFAALFGSLQLLFFDLPWRRLAPGRWGGPGLAIGRGLLIAVPILLVFGSLFAAADAVFAASVNNLFDWNLDSLFEHVFVIGFWGWLATSALYQTMLKAPWIAPEPARPAIIRLGVIEVGIVLGVLNLLFAAFVLVQIRYLFGGATQLNLADGLSYAEYARRGFFELVTVAALALPLLLLAHWVLSPESRRTVRVFGGLAGVLLVLLVVVMISALERMRLYQQEYGLTELRLYTTAFMGWLALVFGWFGLTVLPNRPRRFVAGAAGLGAGVLTLLNLLNPDAVIVRTNAARNAIQPFDSRYAISLSADAVPALFDALPLMSPDQRCSVAAQLVREWSAPDERDWRTWNYSRSQAWALVEANRAELERIACFNDR